MSAEEQTTFRPKNELITIEEALNTIQRYLPPRSVFKVPLLQAVDMVLAEPLVAPEPSPRYTNSAMDGYAVRFADVETAGADEPVQLTVIGESRAGVPFQGTVKPGTAVEISTGAMLPEGADTVVPVEDVRISGDTIVVVKPVRQHQHVRFRGEEFSEGTELLPAGVQVKPTHIALLASLGVVEVPVYRPLRVAILVTGSELVPPEKTPEAHQIRESNGVMLHAAVERSGGIPVYRTIVADDPGATLEALQQAMEHTDVILFSGGVSMGPHDHVKHATVQAGIEPIFWRVKQKPGKPLFFAVKGHQLVFGLPGNPVSAFMTYTYYVHPVLQQAVGLPFAWKTRTVRLVAPLENPLKRAHFVRLRTWEENGEWVGEPLQKQGSHMLTTVAHANGFVKLDVGEGYRPGDTVQVFLFP